LNAVHGCWHDCRTAAFIIVVCSIKMFRSAFTNPSHQFFIIVFTVLFFRYDYAELSESFLIDYFFISILLNKASWTYSIWKLQVIWTLWFMCIYTGGRNYSFAYFPLDAGHSGQVITCPTVVWEDTGLSQLFYHESHCLDILP